MARYNDVLTSRHDYIGLLAWGIITILLLLMLLPFGLIYLVITKVKKLFIAGARRHSVADTQSLPAQ